MLGVVATALPLKCRLSPKKADTLQRLPEACSVVVENATKRAATVRDALINVWRVFSFFLYVCYAHEIASSLACPASSVFIFIRYCSNHTCLERNAHIRFSMHASWQELCTWKESDLRVQLCKVGHWIKKFVLEASADWH